MNTLKSVIIWLVYVCWGIYKYFLHLITGKCMLLRIMHSSISKTQKYLSIENNIRHSKIFNQLDWLNKESESDQRQLITTVLESKQVKDIYHEEFSYYLMNIFDILSKYQCVLDELESLKRTKVDWKIETHKNLLISLWKNLKPFDEIDNELVSKRWVKIGFQGANPVTDFRGMGLLGLLQLEYFAKHFSKHATKMTDFCEDFSVGYPLAVAGINLAALVHSLLLGGALKIVFYSLPLDEIGLDQYNRFFAAVFIRFHRHWCAVNPGVMQFNVEKDRFGRSLLADLANEAAVLEMMQCDSQ